MSSPSIKPYPTQRSHGRAYLKGFWRNTQAMIRMIVCSVHVGGGLWDGRGCFLHGSIVIEDLVIYKIGGVSSFLLLGILWHGAQHAHSKNRAFCAGTQVVLQNSNCAPFAQKMQYCTVSWCCAGLRLLFHEDLRTSQVLIMMFVSQNLTSGVATP